MDLSPLMNLFLSRKKTGLIKPLTHWVLNEALSLCSRLEKQDKKLCISVNISTMNLCEGGFVESVQQLLELYEVSPSLLVLEITESALMKDPEQALHVLNELNTLGVKLSIDDFGTGHSSLSYLGTLPVHEIKIDRSFVLKIHDKKEDAVIVDTIIRMCHNLDYKVVVEGIENEQAFTLLRSMGCDYAQGYFLSRPQSEAHLLSWLDKQH